MLNDLLFSLSLFLLVSTLSFAWWRGGAAERYAAFAIGLTWLAALIGQAFTGETIPALTILLADWVLAIGLAALALRYRNSWLGFALMVQGASMTLHAMYFQEPGRHPNYYLIGIDALSLAMLVLLVVGTVLAMRSRREAAAA
jgi:general stress protein CsbA